MNLDLLENDDADVAEFYKVRWTSPFNDTYTRYVEPGITAINKIYKKIKYKSQSYVVSNKTYEKLSYLKQFRELENLNVNFTNTDDYISKPKLQNIKSKDLDDKQLTTIYLYQSKFYYLYWIEQKEPIILGKKSVIQPPYLAFLENYEYFIEINPLDNHKVIIAFNENSYKILIFKANAKICDSIYSIKWATNTSVFPPSLVKPKFTIKDKDILKYIEQVVDNQKYFLLQFYYYAADFSYPKLNKYKNFKRFNGNQPDRNVFEIPDNFVDSFAYYYNDRSKYIIAKNELAKYIYNKSKKQPSITHYKFANNEIFEPVQEVVFYRGMTLPKENTKILHERSFISITRNKTTAMGFMEMGRQLQDEKSHILYEITLEKGVPFIDFKILGQNALYFEEELLLFTTPCAFRYEDLLPINTGVGVYYICKVFISANELIQYKFKNIPDIKRFKELQLDDSLLSESVKKLTLFHKNKSSASFNISTSTSSINSTYKSRNNVVMQSSEPKSNIQYETTNVILEHTTDKTQYVIYKRTDIKDESVYIYIDNTYYEVSGKITDINRQIINKKITYNIIDKLYKNKNYFVYLNKYSLVCKKLKLIKFKIIYNIEIDRSKSNDI
jgi:hypothetical protein